MIDTSQRTSTCELSGTNVSDVRIPMIGLGTWPMIGRQCTDAVRLALDNGYRHIDTAQKYDNEEAVGVGIRSSAVDRDELFVTSKLTSQFHGGLEQVRTGVERSLAALKLDHLDLMLIHWPNPERGAYVHTAQALAELVETGLLRAWGVSNFKPAHLQRLRQAGLVVPLNQIEVNPLTAQRENQRANAAGRTLTAAYSPIGRGMELSQYPALTGPAERTGHTVHQVVMRWHLQQGRLAIPKSADALRQCQNLDVFDWSLTETEVAAIDALDTGRGPRMDADEYGH